MHKIKIVQVITRLIKGGAQKICLDITEGLPKDRYEVYLISGPETGPEGSLWERATLIKNIRIKIIPELIREISPLNDLLTLIKLYFFFRGTKPKIIHCHTSKAGFIGVISAWLARIPIIIYAPYGHLFSPSAQIPSVSNSNLRLKLFYFLTKLTNFLSTRIIVQNSADKNEQIKLRLARSEKYEVIHNAVEINLIYSNNNMQNSVTPTSNAFKVRDTAGRYPILATLGRLSSEKGQIYLLEAMKSVRNIFPDALLLMMGNGILRKQLEDFVEKENIKHNVKFLGLCNEPSEILKSVDIFILPSLYESFGIVLLEAMAQAKPVIASNVGGIPDVVIHNQTGILVPPANPKLLSEAIIKLINDKELARKFGLAGYERVNKLFRKEQMVNNFDNLYRKLYPRSIVTTSKASQRGLIIEPANKSDLPIIAAMHIDPDNDMITKIIQENSAKYNFYLDKVNMFYRLEPKGVFVAKEHDRILGFIIASKNSDEILKLSLRKGYILHLALKSLLFQYGLNKKMIKKLFLVPYANFIRQRTELSRMPIKVNSSGKLWASVVIKQERNKGIYSKLIEAACDYARKRGAYILSATFTKDNIIPLNHCQKSGFHIIGECLESTGPSYYLIKSLSNIIPASGGSNKYRYAIKQANRNVYNSKSVNEYEQNPSIFEPSRQENIKSILNEISKKAGGDRFLDIGCGTNNLVKIGTNYFRTVIGMDMANNLLKQAKQLQPEINLIVADADYPPFKNNTFNCIALYGTMHHLFKPVETLLRISSLLKSGGILYTDHNPNYFFNRFYHLYYSLRYRHKPGFDSEKKEMAEFHHTRTTGINPESLKKVLLNNGFQDVQIYYRHTTNTSLELPSRLVLYFLKIFSRILPLRSLYTHFYLIANLR